MSKNNKNNDNKELDSLMDDDHSNIEHDESQLNTNSAKSNKEKVDRQKKKNEKARATASIGSGKNKSKRKTSGVRRFFSKYKWYFILCMSSFIAGAVAISFITSGDKSDVYQLNEPMSLEESIDNFRSSQIDALESQIQQINNNAKDGTEDSMDNGGELEISRNKKLFSEAMSTNSKNLDQVLKAIMNVGYDADKDERMKAKQEMLKHIDPKKFSSKTADKLINGNSAGRELRQYGVKSGASMPSIIGVDDDDNFVYLSITPYSVKDRTVAVAYLSKMNKEGKLIDLHYIGYMNSYGHKRAERVTDALKESLEKGTKADKKLDESIDKTLTDEQKENLEKQQKEDDKKQKEDEDKKDKKKDK